MRKFTKIRALFLIGSDYLLNNTARKLLIIFKLKMKAIFKSEIIRYSP